MRARRWATQSGKVSKLQYAKYPGGRAGVLASQQHDPVGLIVFDEEIRSYRPPSRRSGSLHGVLHALDAPQRPAAGPTSKAASASCASTDTRRGLVAVISDFYCDPEAP